jgi:hypothetical protein
MFKSEEIIEGKVEEQAMQWRNDKGKYFFFIINIRNVSASPLKLYHDYE